MGAAGESVTFGLNGLPITGGAAGGSVSATNVDVAGGNVIGAGRIPTLTGGAAGGGAGKSGYVVTEQTVFSALGDSGGGTNGLAGVGGAGGDGAIGSGGGGGGGGVTGGAGGNGGPGMILILWW